MRLPMTDKLATLDLRYERGGSLESVVRARAGGATLLAGGTNLTNADNSTAYGGAPNERILYLGLRLNR